MKKIYLFTVNIFLLVQLQFVVKFVEIMTMTSLVILWVYTRGRLFLVQKERTAWTTLFMNKATLKLLKGLILDIFQLKELLLHALVLYMTIIKPKETYSPKRPTLYMNSFSENKFKCFGYRLFSNCKLYFRSHESLGWPFAINLCPSCGSSFNVICRASYLKNLYFKV